MRQKKAVPRWCAACLHLVLYGYFNLGKRLRCRSTTHVTLPIAYYARLCVWSLLLESLAPGKVLALCIVCWGHFLHATP